MNTTALRFVPRAGDVGEEEQTEIELEPFPEQEPVREPAAPTPEKVPA